MAKKKTDSLDNNYTNETYAEGGGERRTTEGGKEGRKETGEGGRKETGEGRREGVRKGIIHHYTGRVMHCIYLYGAWRTPCCYPGGQS